MNKIILQTLALIASAGIVLAQNENGRTISFKTISPEFANSNYNLFFPLEPLPSDGSAYDGKWGNLRLNKFNTSHEQKAKIIKSLAFFSEASEHSKKVGQVSVKPDTKDAIFFFIASPKSEKYKVYSVDSTTVPQGSFYIMNTSPQKLYFDVGGVKKMIAPGKQASIKPPAGSNKVSIYESKNGKPKLKIHTKWYTDENLREFIFYHGAPLKWNHILDNSVRAIKRTASN